MSLDGATKTSFTGTNQLESKTNYFIGNDESKWQSDIPNYQQLLAKNVYPGIDLKYYGTNSTLEHDFIVSPNTDYSQIAFHFTGQDKLTLDDNGNLILKTANDKDTVTLNAPITYQQTTNSKHTIPSKFNLDTNNNTVTIALNADYDKSQPLIIDPTLTLGYSTYLGGSGSDYSSGIAVDSSGNAYITGRTSSGNFPTTSPYQGGHGSDSGSYDAFVTKINAAGTAKLYSTYFGGSGTDYGYGIAIDSSGNAYVTGINTNNVFVAKFNSTGSTLIYSYIFGGTGTDVGYGIAVDSSGNAYVTGRTSSTDFSTTATRFQATRGGAADEGFVTKINSAGSAKIYSSYLGGSGQDYGRSIAVDASGNAYVAGYTSSTNFPTTLPFQASNSGGYDAFFTKINAAGSAKVYSSYLGGSGNEFYSEVGKGMGIVVDSDSSVYMVGTTDSVDFPTTSPFQAVNAGGQDVFITKINADGLAMAYSTYLGGTASDTASGVAIDSGGNAYLAGITQSTDFPTASPFQGSHASDSGNSDAFITTINAAGSAKIYSTYLGGSVGDSAHGIAIDSSNNAYVAGYTTSVDFPTVSPFQAANGGGSDAFIAKFSIPAIATPAGHATSLSTPLIGATGVTMTMNMDGQTANTIRCVKATFTDTKGSLSKPTGMNITGATLGSGSTLIPTPASWSVSANNTTGVVSFTNAAGETTQANNALALIVGGITNGTVPNTTYYTEIDTFSDVGCTTLVDAFDPTFVYTAGVDLTAQVNPTLTFTVGSTSCALGALSNSQTKACTYAMTAATNGTTGYTISYIPAVTLTSGANTITALASQTASTLNTEQFGINLQANTAVGSHTASDFGVAVTGGSGTVAATYNTANSFKFATAGDIVAQSAVASLTSTYTISTIANITNATEAGAYLTVLTYNIVAGY
jgi:hypothetical protein